MGSVAPPSAVPGSGGMLVTCGRAYYRACGEMAGYSDVHELSGGGGIETAAGKLTDAEIVKRAQTAWMDIAPLEILDYTVIWEAFRNGFWWGFTQHLAVEYEKG